MKKLLIFALVSASLTSLFAEAFSIKTFSELKKPQERLKYAYSSDVSKQSNYHHIYNSLLYIARQKNFKLTLDQINNVAKKFQKIDKNYYNRALVMFLPKCGFENEALKIAGTNRVLLSIAKRSSFFYFVKQRNKDKIWSNGKQVLIADGQGVVNYKDATRILNEMFRYKPASITKEQQIEFLTKLSQIYPIPGTDFNNWKGFMGFLGYKYKALTGKELF